MDYLIRAMSQESFATLSGGYAYCKLSELKLKLQSRPSHGLMASLNASANQLCKHNKYPPYADT